MLHRLENRLRIPAKVISLHLKGNEKRYIPTCIFVTLEMLQQTTAKIRSINEVVIHFKIDAASEIIRLNDTERRVGVR